LTRLFGTDGVRGKAGEYPLDPATVRRLGAALVRALRHADDAPLRFLVGRDTRESGEWIERELARGIADQGGDLTSLGVVPTPAVAYLTPLKGFTAGVVISASHNPFEDNGIKVFSGAGEKFTEASEREVESIVDDTSWAVGDAHDVRIASADYRDDYLSHLQEMLPPSSRLKLRLAIDCANGATTTVAPQLFKGLGFDTLVIGKEPDGRNINLGCGSTAPQLLAKTVVGGRYHLGIAFDGDGDRAIFVDANGRVVDGDAVMLMCATALKAEGRLRNNAIVATVMSNIGLEIALRQAGIGLVRCPVGDKYVMEEMARRGLALGGEQSGHVIFSDYLFTGDGLATALGVLRTMAATGRSLADLASDLTTYPQILMNLRVKEKVDLQTVPAIAAVLRSVESRLEGSGRLLVRYSGTEPLLRVMLEGKDQAEIGRWGQEIIDTVAQHLGTA
jgi:phosphoglucosamine mutase